MSKWNKIQKAPSSQFLENEERRKQMIIEAATRRKEKERRMLEQVELERKNNEQALLRHKQEKKDAYVKYLRNNMHDKYEEEKRKAKEKDPEIKATKWKKKSTEKDQLDALNLELQFSPKKQTENHSSSNIPSSIVSKNIKRELLAEQFEKEWQFQQQRQEQMLSSKLLDSLDLDFGTLARDLEINALVNKQKEEKRLQKQYNAIDQVRNLIGYESVVVQDSSLNKQQQKIEIKATKDFKKQLKKEDKAEKGKEVNEAEVMNELKNKKEGKILHWAIEEEAEAEDLFSNCSTKKKSSKALKELNDEIRMQKKQQNKNTVPLKVIPEITEKQGMKQKQRSKVSKERKNKSQQRVKDQTNQKKELQQKIPPSTQSHQNFHIQTNPKPNQTTYNDPKVAQKQQSKTSQSFSQQKKNLTRIRNLSRDKQKNSIGWKQVVSKEKGEPLKKLNVLPPLPRPGDQMTEATDMQFEIESYIKQDLINLNLEERQQQEALRQLHNHNKQQLKEIYNKHNIKTNYHHSSQITGDNTKPASNTPEQQLQDSIQRLDDLLMRRQIESRGNQAEQKSIKSIINPFSNSEDLMNQVLQLAENISKFQKPPNSQQQGYAQNFKRKVRKTPSQQKIQVRVSPARQDLSVSRQVSQMTSQSENKPLERPPLILETGDDVGRIHINERLRRLLLQD